LDDLAIERADWVTLLSNLTVTWSLCIEILVHAIDANNELPARVLKRATP
jgi:hypothetical protein